MDSPELRVRLLGELVVTYGEIRLTALDSTRAVSLLAYLVLNRHIPQRRERLAFLLWPESSESQARTNLRHVLHNLRHALPNVDRLIEITTHTVQWRSASNVWIDVVDFEELLDQTADGGTDDRIEMLRRAATLYTGDLLAGFDDEWILTERERLRREYAGVLDRLIREYEGSSNFSDAVWAADRLLRLDPLDEQAHRALMRLYDARGNRAQALQQYHACVAILERELGVEPSDETRAAYESLLPASERETRDEEPEAASLGQPVIGRLTERRRLSGAWQSLARTGPRFVLISGEAGIGKTHLVEDFAFRCTHLGASVAFARAFQAEGTLAFGPLTSWLRALARANRLARIELPQAVQLARLLPELAAQPPVPTPPEIVAERDQRQQLFDAAADVILSAPPPLLLVADDLQWYDQETMQFLHFLIRRDPAARLLVVATLRTGETDTRHPVNDLLTSLKSLERLIEIDLEPLSRDETITLAERISGHALFTEDADDLFRHTEGNPLFVVEAVRAGWETARRSANGTNNRVQAVIERRLAHLSVASQELIGVAATIGREFDSNVLAHASGFDEETLVMALDELWRRRLIREQGSIAYDFCHDRVREVAYQSLSPAQRRHHHLHVARSLAYLCRGRSDQFSGDIARHFEEGADIQQAIGWYRQAAAAALRVFAVDDAITLLDHVLDLLNSLPHGRERDAEELDILSSFPSPLLAREAFASERLTAIHTRAYRLSRSSGLALPPPMLRSIAVAALTRNDFESARQVGEQLAAQGEAEPDDVLVVEAMYLLGIGAFWRGELLEARRCFERAVAAYRDQDRETHLLHYGQDPKVVCLSRLANTMWFLGDIDGACRARDAALAAAAQIEHPVSHLTAIVFAALLALDSGDVDGLRDHVSSLVIRMEKQTEGRQFISARLLLRSYLDVLDRQDHTGIDRIRQTFENRSEFELAPGHFWVMTRLLIAAYAAARDAQSGLVVADAVLRSNVKGAWEAEVRRLRAEFLADLGAPSSEVEAELLRALETARRQSARSLELKVFLSLLRHHRQEGNITSIGPLRDSMSAVIRQIAPFGSSTDLLDARAALAAL